MHVQSHQQNINAALSELRGLVRDRPLPVRRLADILIEHHPDNKLLYDYILGNLNSELGQRVLHQVMLVPILDKLVGADLHCQFFRGCDFRGADLTRTDLRACNLVEANFSGNSMVGARLTRADLAASDLSHAELTVADLREAHLYAADLQGANFQGANLEEAYMVGVNVVGASFSGARLDKAILRSVAWDHTTSWPAGFDMSRLG